ncbi:flavin-containing monooxygenase [Actinokineospora iranica]|uniref:4-hydroxyacetophenone monooxygenase n=1 Tax=Actinokineospora iranica TaxID=1271860 RepID=A0A1G6S8I0_9PSEU|nr:NAD(P)/FAD-dependent oxidoreductase [Actinokineospora iranica]SDD12427.1 4-hydroxyacetophenone monooxygenase [Actinokineospora iranica]
MRTPITADDDALRAYLADAEVPALLMTVAHLTGDLSALRADQRAAGWLFQPQGGLTERQQERARDLAFAALVRLRDGEIDVPPPPDPETLRAITSWAIGSDTADLLPLLAEEIVPAGADPKAPRWTKADLAPTTDFGVVIVGAGFSGLLAGHRLAQAGVPFVIYEKNPDVGGTWFENTYPGCRVDVASHLYNYSFAPKLDWPDHFCVQEVVLDYLRSFAEESGLTDAIRFGAEVTGMAWDDTESVWRVSTRTTDGAMETVVCQAVVTAVGQLNRPRLPEISGRDSFTGPAFHSAAWDHSVDLAGKRVAVVGTGASAFQLIPEIADVASELTVFQRNPPWLRPTPHYRDPVPDGARWLFEHVPYYARWHRFWLFAPGLRGILEGWIVDPDYPPTERAVSALNDRLRSALLASMEAQLADAPDLREQVIPRYPVGAKRVLRDDGRWLATLKRDDVELVTAPIERITETGIVAGDREFPADVVIYATGFEASKFLAPMTVTGRGGVDLHGMWNGVPHAYLGVTIPGFPNLFCLYGPNTNLVGQGGSIVYFSECAVTYVLDALRLLLATGKRAIEVRKDVHDDYSAWVDQGNRTRAWGFSTVTGWYSEGGHSAPNWPYSTDEYWRRTHRVDPTDYLIT